MKHFIAQVSGALAASQFFVGKALAAASTSAAGGGGLNPPPAIGGLSNDTDIKTAIVSIIVWVLDFVLLIAVVFVIVAGIRLIISGGDEGEKDKAKQTIIYVIVGIVVVIFARVIVMFVSNIFKP